MIPIFKTRNFLGFQPPLPLQWVVNKYSHHAIGGPKQAQIKASGSSLALWELIEYLRCPVEIYNDLGEIVWWGYIAEVRLTIGKVEVVVTLNDMYNRISVAYTASETGSSDIGGRQTTAWAEDAESVEEYGRRELLYTTTGSTSEHALAARDMILSEKHYPVPGMAFQKENAQEDRVVLECRGWYDTLEWRYYALEAGMEAYAENGTGDQDLGNSSANQKVAQGFRFSQPWVLKSVEINIRKENSPADNVIIDVCADSSGAPGAVIASGTISASLVAGNYGWVQVPLASEISILPDVLYWLAIRRSGGVDGVNYFKLDVNEDLGYPDGGLKIWNDSAWVNRTPDADLLFRLTSTEDTAVQARNIALQVGQFFSGVEAELSSGILTNQYRDGDATGLFEIEELLKMGTSNKRRMLARVDPIRQLIFYEEPVQSVTPYLVDSSGQVRSANDTPIRKDKCLCAEWVKLKDVIPGSVDASKLADPTWMFIEEAEYDPSLDSLRLSPRGAMGLWEVGKVVDG